MKQAAKTYFRSQVLLLQTDDYWNCLGACKSMAKLLLEQGRSPWIGRLRRHERQGDVTFFAPLIPLKLLSRAWTTHYVCIAEGIVYDPAAMRPLRLSRYSRETFGTELPIETFVSKQEIGGYISGEIGASSPRS